MQTSIDSNIDSPTVSTVGEQQKSISPSAICRLPTEILSQIFLLCDKPFVMDDFHALKELTILQRGNDPARAIHKLDLTLVSFNPKQLDPDSAWACLTHVEINPHGLDEFIHLLRLCPNLSSLSMSEIKNPIKIESPEPVTHDNLQYLIVRGQLFNHNDLGVGLFNAITPPTFASLIFAKGGCGHMESSRRL
ncbi:hypothetical protein EDD22DRAFT_842790 [Suillus occidentalis]|nr:hypothetical protein EDD22DRAFT_842790 [Suillus occidentalis]